MAPEEKHLITKQILDWLKENYIKYDHRDEFDIQGLLVDLEYYLTHEIQSVMLTREAMKKSIRTTGEIICKLIPMSRLGQNIFNYIYNFIKACNMDMDDFRNIVKDCDCYYNDSKVEAFLDTVYDFYGKYVNEWLNDSTKHFFPEGEDKYSVADLFYAGVRCGQTWTEKQKDNNKPNWKPSKEQLEALDYAYNSCPDTERGNYYEGVLETLIDDLHKLSKKQSKQKLLNDDKYQTVSVEILDRLYESEKELERLKQSEQIDEKFEPMFNFKVGQWIVATGKCVYLITKIDGFHVTLVDTNGDECVFGVSSLDDAHLWTIKDAKDGDVLVCGAQCHGKKIEQAGIYKEYIGRHGGCSNSFKIHAGIDWDKHLLIDNTMGSSEIYPATKEQRDLLFQKMKEAGYEWDDGKKELKKITMKYIDLGLLSGTLWADTNEEGYYTFNDAVEKYGNNLPTREQFEELKDQCKWEWKNGRSTVTGPNGNCIILPADGNYNYNGRLYGVGSIGFYWSSAPYDSDDAWSLGFYSGGVDVYYNSRGFGKSVRLVK